MVKDSCYKYMAEIHDEIFTNTGDPDFSLDAHLRRPLSQALEAFKAVEDQDAIIFIGGDKSGKSTLINHLLGNPLEVNGPTDRQMISIVPGYVGPTITMKPYQQVRVPSVFNNSKILEGKLLIEFPGHGKFSSVDQQRLNHLVAPILYASPKQVKLVLVWNVMDILTGRFNEFVQQIKFLDDLFGKQLSFLIPCISIVFTQMPEVHGEQQVNTDFIMRSINQFVSSSVLVYPPAKKLLMEISSQRVRHGIFKKPSGPGPLMSRLDMDFQKSLMNGSYITHDELLYYLFDIPLDSACLFSQDLAGTVGEITFAKLDDAVTQITTGSLPLTNGDSQTEEELMAHGRRLTNYLESVLEGLQPNVYILRKIEILEALDPSLAKIVQERCLYRKLEKTKVMRNAMNGSMRRLCVFDQAMNHLLGKVYSDSEILIKNIELQLRILEEVEAARELQRKNEKLEKESIKLMNKINLMRCNELNRRSFFFEFFRRNRVHARIVEVLTNCTQPLVRKVLRMPGFHYVASRLRSSVIAITDVIERERIAVSN